MGRLRLYAGNGQQVFDSDGRPSEEPLDRVKAEYNAGVAFYYDPRDGIVRGQVKLQRHGPEQFIAAYTTTDPSASDDLLKSFTEAVASAAEGQDWSIRHDAGGNQAVYNAFSSEAASGPDRLSSVNEDFQSGPLSLERLRSEIGTNSPVTLLVPDYETAANALAYFRDKSGDSWRIAISESSEAPTIQTADLLLRPSGRVDSIVPGPELDAKLREEQAAAIMEEFETQLEHFATTVNRGSSSPARRMAGILRQQGFDGRLGINLTSKGRKDDWRQQARYTSQPVAFLTVALALGLWMIPRIRAVEFVILGTSAGVLAAIVIVASIGRFLPIDLPIPAKETGINRATDISTAESSAADSVIESLERLNRTVDSDVYLEQVTELFGRYDLKLADESNIETTEWMGLLLGILVGFLVGLLAFLLVVTVIGILGL